MLQAEPNSCLYVPTRSRECQEEIQAYFTSNNEAWEDKDMGVNGSTQEIKCNHTIKLPGESHVYSKT